MSVTTPKPPTQVAGVAGIAPTPIELTPAQPKRINWTQLFSLPTFQMFAVERAGKSSADVMEWMPAWAREHDEQGIYDDYCKWHADKGYWPNENPDGSAI